MLPTKNRVDLTLLPFQTVVNLGEEAPAHGCSKGNDRRLYGSSIEFRVKNHTPYAVDQARERQVSCQSALGVADWLPGPRQGPPRDKL